MFFLPFLLIFFCIKSENSLSKCLRLGAAYAAFKSLALYTSVLNIHANFDGDIVAYVKLNVMKIFYARQVIDMQKREKSFDIVLDHIDSSSRKTIA
jgi:hypothetical protein